MPIYAFVDAPVTTPTILLDLDNETPLIVVEAPSTNPPSRRVNASGSAARNGDVIAQMSYPDRKLTIPLEFVVGTTAEQQSETMQTLSRLLDGPQWLMWQSDAKIEPVFFRTKYGDLEIQDSIADGSPDRALTITLTAEPFAYGEKVTGTAVVANDPTAATNPMSYTFGDIEGDVEAPLFLQWPWPSALPGVSRLLVASLATDDLTSTFTAVPLGAGTAPAAGAGYTITDAADTTMVAGERRRVAKSILAPDGATQTVWTGPVPVAPGDYRVLVRVRDSLTTPAPGGLFGNIRVNGEDTFVGSLTYSGGGSWIDCGVRHLPANVPDTDQLHPLPAIDATLTVELNDATPISGNGQYDFDAALLVPAGVHRQAASHLALIDAPDPVTETVFVDAQSDIAYEVDAPNLFQFFTVAGSLPTVVPGKANRLMVVSTILNEGEFGGSTADDKTATLAIQYAYYPRYLYDRPATS